jgi:hypothetical protein
MVGRFGFLSLRRSTIERRKRRGAGVSSRNRAQDDREGKLTIARRRWCNDLAVYFRNSPGSCFLEGRKFRRTR